MKSHLQLFVEALAEPYKDQQLPESLDKLARLVAHVERVHFVESHMLNAAWTSLNMMMKLAKSLAPEVQLEFMETARRNGVATGIVSNTLPILEQHYQAVQMWCHDFLGSQNIVSPEHVVTHLTALIKEYTTIEERCSALYNPLLVSTGLPLSKLYKAASLDYRKQLESSAS